jgi:hypothetical protein
MAQHNEEKRKGKLKPVISISRRISQDSCAYLDQTNILVIKYI